jgi:hypothetical protein
MKYAAILLVGLLIGCGGRVDSITNQVVEIQEPTPPDTDSPPKDDQKDDAGSNPDCTANPNAPGCPDPTCSGSEQGCGNEWCWPNCPTGEYHPGPVSGTNVGSSGGAQNYQ